MEVKSMELRFARGEWSPSPLDLGRISSTVTFTAELAGTPDDLAELEHIASSGVAGLPAVLVRVLEAAFPGPMEVVTDAESAG